MANKGLLLHQFDFKPSVQRSGQINFGLVHFQPPLRPPWTPTEGMFVSKPAVWERNHRRESCQPNPKWIDTEADLKNLIDLLECEDEFCLHVRSCSHNTPTLLPTAYTTLIQIATWERGDFLIWALPLRDAIERQLKSVLENPSILKIMCNSKPQVIALQRDYSIYIHGIADVLELVKMTKPACSTYYLLCKEYCAFELETLVRPSSKTWIRKASPDDHIHFSSHQVHFVLRIFNRLRHEARRNELAQCFYNSQVLSETICPIPSEDEACISLLSATSLFVANFTKHKELWTEKCQYENFKDRNKQTIVALIEFRLMLSKVMNVIPEEIMTDAKLFQVSSFYNPTPPFCLKFVKELQYITGPQQTFLLDILCSERPKSVIAGLREHKCRNCLTTGHGYADLCIFPKSPGTKTFMEYFNVINSYFNIPENVELKKAYGIQLELHSRRQEKCKQEASQALQQLQNVIW